MKYEVVVLDRGRPIAKHSDLEKHEAAEVAEMYVALGWLPEKVLIQAESRPLTKAA